MAVREGAQRARTSLSLHFSASWLSEGAPADRAKVALPSQSSVAKFPAIAPISVGFELVKEEGKGFKEVYGEVPYRGLEDGPGPVPEFLEDQASFCGRTLEIGVQRVHIAFAAGFWARIALETCTPQTFSIRLSEPACHFIVLRAQGLGGHIQFASENDFDCFKDRVRTGDLVAQGFATETEISVFCYAARIALPPIFKQC